MRAQASHLAVRGRNEGENPAGLTAEHVWQDGQVSDGQDTRGLVLPALKQRRTVSPSGEARCRAYQGGFPGKPDFMRERALFRRRARRNREQTGRCTAFAGVATGRRGLIAITGSGDPDASTPISDDE